jgi:hypothetical protein
MKRSLIILFLYLSLFQILSAQSWKTDTTWINGQGSEWDTLISKAQGFSVWHDAGKVILGGYRPRPEYGDFPYLLEFNLADAEPVALSIPFTGFPEKFKNSSNVINHNVEHFFQIPEHNRILWHKDHFVTVTDTNYRYIKSYFEPMEWKNNKDKYYADYTMHINAHHYIRFLGAKYERKDFTKGKREGIARFGKFEAPGLRADEFVGIGRLNLHDLLNTKDVKIRHEKLELFKLCDTLHNRWTINRYATFLDNKDILWFSDDFGRNLVRYDLNSGHQNCYSLMNSRPAFLPDQEYDILREPFPLNDKREYDFNKINIDDFGPQIYHAEKGRIGVLDHSRILVDESRDMFFRAYVIHTKDSAFIETLKPYFLSGAQFNPIRWYGSQWFMFYEYRKLSTMEITQILAVPDREYLFVNADAKGITFLKAIGNGNERKLGLVKVSGVGK